MYKNEYITVIPESMTVEIALKNAKELSQMDDKIFTALAYAAMEETAEKYLDVSHRADEFEKRLVDLCTSAGDPISKHYLYVSPQDAYPKFSERFSNIRFSYRNKSSKDNNYYVVCVF